VRWPNILLLGVSSWFNGEAFVCAASCAYFLADASAGDACIF
jgi:hypothetical protein